MSHALVSLNDILEVHIEGLNTEVLLVFSIKICEYFINLFKTSTCKYFNGIFSPFSIFFNRTGEIVVELKSINDVPKEFVPPELSNIFNEKIYEPQLIWCLGKVAKHSAHCNFSDSDLFSLFNLLTIEENLASNRPTFIQLKQILLNKIQNFNLLENVLVDIYKDLMGDIDELIEDKFYDDIRFSSTRSSLSIISGGLQFSNKNKNLINSSEFDTREQLNLDLQKPYVIEDKADDTSALINKKEKKIIIDKKINVDLLSIESDQCTSFNLENSNFILNYNQKSFKLKKKDVTNNLPYETIINKKQNNIQLNNFDIEFKKFSSENVDKIQKVYNLSTVSQNNNNVVSVQKKLVNDLPMHVKTTKEKKKNFKYESEKNTKIKDDKENLNKQNFFQPSHHQNNNKNSFDLKLNSYENSLLSSIGSKFAIPEFLEKSTMLPIRLKAQSLKKKKLAFHRQENAIVLVKLLTGQCVEVNCSTNTLVLNIFETVAAHLNITEHLFFGLALLKNSEYYFLDNDKRLDKWAFLCWKNSRNSLSIYSPSISSGIAVSQLGSSMESMTTNTNYFLHLRFRYYPKKIEFIQTKVTMHYLYLQLRQDILDGVLRFNDNFFACKLAALALQAEFGNFPYNEKNILIEKDLYYKFENYLPTNFYNTNELVTSITDLKNKICDFHFQLKDLNQIEAEKIFITYCQNSNEYGVHYYRVFKVKPSSTSARQAYFSCLSNVHQLAITPLGITIFREQTTTGVRHVQTAYEWSNIRTLQFDRKRILIATLKNDILIDHVFYTDHYSKSSYLIRFAATQHRFMMKMRHWQTTLNCLKGNDFNNVSTDNYLQPIDVSFTKKSLENNDKNNEFKNSNEIKNFVDSDKINTILPEQILKTKEVKNVLQKIDSDYIRDFYGLEAKKLNVVLEKRSDIGLGLTLVDGVINGIKGVYIKSVSEKGDAKKKGLNIGDCILSINKISLFNNSRHDAVELVKKFENKVEIEFLRFLSINEILFSKNNFNENNLKFPKILKQEELKRYSFNKKKTSIISHKLKKYNQRAVSDFGGIGDSLPVLNSEELIIETIKKKTSSSSNSEESINEFIDNTSLHTLKQGSYNIEVNRMYKNFYIDDDNTYKIDNKTSNLENSVESTEKLNNISKQYKNKIKDFDNISWATKLYDETTLSSYKSDILLQDDIQEKNSLVLANDIPKFNDGNNNINTINVQKYSQILKIEIQRAFIDEKLGFKIEPVIEDINNSNNDRSLTFFMVKQITSIPAVESNLKVGDIIRKINNKEITGLPYEKVMKLLSSGLNLVLEIERTQLKDNNKVKEREKIICVTIDKSKSKSIGLTLGKRMGHEGIYIRNIALDSLAFDHSNEKLCIGDRIWMINGELVSNKSSREIVFCLSQINGVFEICVKRKISV